MTNLLDGICTPAQAVSEGKGSIDTFNAFMKL